jgi:hypothetical protein
LVIATARQTRSTDQDELSVLGAAIPRAAEA